LIPPPEQRALEEEIPNVFDFTSDLD
jgi:hypothetical protein